LKLRLIFDGGIFRKVDVPAKVAWPPTTVELQVGPYFICEVQTMLDMCVDGYLESIKAVNYARGQKLDGATGTMGMVDPVESPTSSPFWTTPLPS
ncbi:MAG: hypothetical protein ACREOZ_04530, partial [Gloeomargaritales cyanobacterium]